LMNWYKTHPRFRKNTFIKLKKTWQNKTAWIKNAKSALLDTHTSFSFLQLLFLVFHDALKPIKIKLHNLCTFMFDIIFRTHYTVTLTQHISVLYHQENKKDALKVICNETYIIPLNKSCLWCLDYPKTSVHRQENTNSSEWTKFALKHHIQQIWW